MEQNPEINPYAYGQLILNKCQGNWIGKRLSFQQTVLEQLDIQMQKNEPWPLTETKH